MPHRHDNKHGTRNGLALTLVAAMVLTACGGGTGDASTQAKQGTVLAAQITAAEVPLTVAAATATASERGDLGPDKAVDHDATTRWSSGFSDDQNITLDFGQSQSISRVQISWENAHATAYLLQVSDDDTHWTTIKSVTDSVGGVENLTDLAAQGRYLRMQGVHRSTQYGYSIFEIQAFSGAPVAIEPTDPGTPVSNPGAPGVVVKPVGVVSSSDENGGLAARNAIDGNAQTRWASKA